MPPPFKHPLHTPPFTTPYPYPYPGHRHPVAAVKLMCDRSPTEREHRALTVDTSGEFRLWNIYVRERTSVAIPVPTMQIFTTQVLPTSYPSSYPINPRTLSTSLFITHPTNPLHKPILSTPLYNPPYQSTSLTHLINPPY